MKYVLINRATNAKIETTIKYLTHWIARGFEVHSIKNS